MIGDAIKTIGPGWSSDPVEREAQVIAQERLVSEMAALAEQFPEWELEAICDTESER